MSRATFSVLQIRPATLALAAMLTLTSCGDDAPPAKPPLTLPPIEVPSERVVELEALEDLTEEVTHRLITLCDLLRRGRIDDARPFLADDFVGHDLSSPSLQGTAPLPLGIEDLTFATRDAAVVDREEFLSGVGRLAAEFGELESFVPKTRGAEFSRETPRIGVLSTDWKAMGTTPDGGRMSRVATCRAQCELRDGSWLLTRLELVAMAGQRRAAPLYTDVARSAGVAHQGPRFGSDGNDSFFWNGAAAHDVDRDGRIDLFVTSQERNFLYRNKGDGTFEDVAETLGLDQPARGTGALFFDADDDGDADLFLGFTSFTDQGEVIGRPCAFFEQGPDGSFRECAAERGLAKEMMAFSAVAADIDNDGHLDLYVCGYNAEGFVAPDSWHAASNGTPNALFHNRGDGTFEDIATRAGVDDATSWSYAAAFADFDRDGDQDLYVANDYGPNRFYVNNGGLTFTDRAEELGVSDVGNGMGASFGDIDGDGDLDLYVSNMSSTAGNRILNRFADPTSDDATAKTLRKLAAGNSIYRFDGSKFVRLPADDGGIDASWAWSAQFTDLDLDGDDDLVCVNGFISGDADADFKDT